MGVGENTGSNGKENSRHRVTVSVGQVVFQVSVETKNKKEREGH